MEFGSELFGCLGQRKTCYGPFRNREVSSVAQTSPINSPGFVAPPEISAFLEAGESSSSGAEYMGERSSRPQIFGLKAVES